MTLTDLSTHIAGLNASLRNAKTSLRLFTQNAGGRVWLYTSLPDSIDGAMVMAVGQPAKVAQVATEWTKKQAKR